MSKRLILITAVCFFLICSSSLALASFEPIFPINDTLIGGNYKYLESEYDPYISLAYDLFNNKIYYNLGSKYKYNDQVFFKLQYNYWKDNNIKGYLNKRGFQTDMCYTKDLETDLEVSYFNGEVEESSESIKTEYINLNYKKVISDDWNNKLDFHLDITSGRVKKDNDKYFIYNLSIPIRLNSFSILSQLGYIKEAELIKPYYSLGNYVKGYSCYNQENTSGEIGNRVLSLAVEKEIELLPYTDIPILNLVNLIISINAGDTLKANERLNDFQLHSSFGVGLNLDLGSSNLRLERVITDQRGVKTLFYFQRKI